MLYITNLCAGMKGLEPLFDSTQNYCVNLEVTLIIHYPFGRTLIRG
nr:MAG TPA: hypothetical protein [Crassvirales sp.]